MQVLEKILEEIDKLKEKCLLSEFESGYAAGALDMANAIKDVIYKCGSDNDSWIPVNERLPEESGYYMTCIYNTEVDEYDFRTAWFKQKDEFDLDESEWQDLFGFEKVTGWNTLPEPCKLEEPKTVKNTQQEIEDFWRDK